MSLLVAVVTFGFGDVLGQKSNLHSKDLLDLKECIKSQKEEFKKEKSNLKESFKARKKEYVKKELNHFVEFYFDSNRTFDKNNKFEDNAKCTLKTLQDTNNKFQLSRYYLNYL